MKIRRTLSAAAATAIVPAVLLGATAAHADAANPAATSTSTSTSTTAPTSTDAPTSTSSSAPTTTTSPTSTATASATPSATSSLKSCSSGPSSEIAFTLKGVPSRIVAGDGWHTFTLTATGKSDRALGAIDAAVTADNGEDSYNADLYKTSYLEFWDPSAAKWLSLKDEGKDDIRETGLVYGSTTLKTAHASSTMKFRIRLTADSTPGDAWVDGGGSFVDTAKNCTRGSTTDSTFVVVAAGTKSGSGGTAASSSAGSSTTPDGGTLAETGSSSATPVIAGVGGAAVLAGAAAVGVARRRRKGSAAA